jgi:pimeloyl-ACP methyl ester carboxylesterase
MTDNNTEWVDVGGRRLAFEASRFGPPSVVLESGLGAESSWWGPVYDAIGKEVTVCRFDRAGKGASDPAPVPRSSLDMAADLHAMLANAAIPGPYVLVGQSIGGLNHRVFASSYPESVAGVLLVESTVEDQFEAMASLFPPPFPGEPGALTGLRQFWTQDWSDPAKNAEGVDFRTSFDQGRHVGSLGNLPLVVLTADYQNSPDMATAPEPFRQAWAQVVGSTVQADHAVDPEFAHRRA